MSPFLPFYVIDYALSLVIWSCVGRFLLSFIVPTLQPGNYIWRAFLFLTGWAVRGAAWLTPSVVRPLLLPLVAAFWLYHLRFASYYTLLRLGAAPTGPG